jgi:DNA primase
MALGHVQLTPQLVRAVREAADVVQIASEHTRLKKAGRRFSGLCPLHKEKTPSFSVDPAQGLFYCFGCGAGGDAIKLHMLTSGDDFPGAIETLALRYSIPLPAVAQRQRGSGVEERDLEGVLELAAGFFAEQLRRNQEARAYLERRRIPAEMIERFGLGYAPDGWRNLVEGLRAKAPLADLEAAGLVGRPEGGGDPYDRFRHRLMFPIRSPSGRILGFGGRTLGDDKAKYVNTAETERFHKGSLLYGLDQAKRALREQGRALLVEGYFDVLAAVASGVDWAVASMGTALTPEQAHLLARYSEEVVIGYDGDEAGDNAARRALSLLLAEGLGVRRARWGSGHDPDSLRLAQGEATVVAAVAAAQDLVGLEIDRLIPPEVHRNPRLRAKAASAIAELLKPIRDGILRYSYGRAAADRLGVPADLLWRRLGVNRETLAPPAAVAPVRREVRNLEDRILDLCFTAPEELPPPGALPPAEAFHDPISRNIFGAFLRLYERSAAAAQTKPPEPRAVLAELAEEGPAIDRMAQLLIEESVSPKPGELGVSLRQLTRRWERQRVTELTREIAEADRMGDGDRLEILLGEKAQFNQRLHARPAVATRPARSR